MSVAEQGYLQTSNISKFYDVSNDFFYALKSSGKAIKNKHYIQNGKLLLWDLVAVDDLLKGSDVTVDSVVNDLLEKIEV